MRALLLLLLASAMTFGGSPSQRNVNGFPLRHPPSVPLVYNIVEGDLNANYDSATVRQFVRDEFGKWMDIPGSNLVITEGEVITTPITGYQDILDAVNAGLNPIVMDEDGSVSADFGFMPEDGVLAFASAAGGAPRESYPGMYAVIGGPPALNASETQLRSTILHELGHALGLGHTVVVGHLAERGGSYESFGPVPPSAAEIMYWREVFGGNAVLKQDDISGYLAMYGSAASGSAQTGGIRGRILRPDAYRGGNGVNVIAHDVGNGGENVFTHAASVISWGPNGDYEIIGLPPGEYTVEVQDLAASGGGAYSQGLRTDNANGVSGSSTIYGGFPGVRELYDSSESNRPELDDPDARTAVTVTAGTVTEGVDIVFNREEGSGKGTLMPEIYHIPEVISDGETDTYVGIVNPTPNAMKVEITGFADDGGEILVGPNLVDIPAMGKLDFTVSDRFGDRAGELGWLQVGAPGRLHVYGELLGSSTRAAWWASDGFTDQAFLPHVARDTATFETIIASVNGTDSERTSTLTAQPTAIEAPLVGHEVPFGRERNDLASLFGGLQEVDWADLRSDDVATASMEYFVAPLGTRSRMAALGLTPEKGKRLRFLHIATDIARFWTGLVYFNAGEVAVTANETYYDGAGNVLATVEKSLDPGEKVTRVLLQGLPVETGGVPEGSAWMEVTVSQESEADLVGYELFSSPDPEVHDIFTGLQGSYTDGNQLDYPHFQGGDDRYTAIVATNLGDAGADLQLDLIGADGTVIASQTLSGIGPGEKRATLITASFFGVDSVEAGAWLRGTATGSRWAGFALWGDFATEGQPPQFLSGVNASPLDVAGPPPPRRIVEESSALHNSYETAQVLEPENGAWNINVVGTISQFDDNDAIINIHDFPSSDGIEDVYSFTLTEPTRLLIAANPDDPVVDLDLFVTRKQISEENFFLEYPENDPDFDFAAAEIGIESVARVFEPGTYYILVSHFDGDVFQGPNPYGLLVTSHPLYLETFDAPESVENWRFQTLDTLNNSLLGDSDGEASWRWSDIIAPTKYGGILRQDPPASGERDHSWAVSPFIEIPESGHAVLDFDISAEGGINFSETRFYITPLTEDPAFWPLTGYLTPLLRDNPITVNGQTVELSAILPWVYFLRAETGQFLFTREALGDRFALAIGAQSGGMSWFVDNIRVYTMQTSADPGKRVKATRIENHPGKPDKHRASRRDLEDR